MDPTIPQPYLIPRHAELLNGLYSHRLDILNLAAQEQLSSYEIDSFTKSAAVQSHLAALESFLQSTFPLRALAARFAILTHLEEAAKTTQNPTEKRLAANAILRAISSPALGGRVVLRSAETASNPPNSPPHPSLESDEDLTLTTPPESDPPDPNANLSRAYRAAAAAIRSTSHQTPQPDPPQPTSPPQAEGLNVSSRGSTRFASPPEFASISRTLNGCSSYLPTQPSAQHARPPLDLLARAGQAPITSLEHPARPP